MKITIFSVAALASLASAAPANVDPDYHGVGRRANIVHTCTSEQLPIIQSATRNCASAAKRAAGKTNDSALLKAVFGKSDGGTKQAVKTVFDNIAKECGAVTFQDQAIVNFMCIKEAQGYCAPEVHEGTPRALANPKTGVVYLCNGFFKESKKVGFGEATGDRLSTNGLRLIRELAQITKLSGPATNLYSPSLFGRFAQTIYDGPDRTQRYSKAMKNHKKRASFDQACLPAQRTVIDAALKSCASVAQLAANEALTSTLFRDAFSKDDAKHRKPVHDVFQNIYKECASAEQDDPANVNFICTENAQEALCVPSATSTKPKAVMVDRTKEGGTGIVLCPAFFTAAKKVAFGNPNGNRLTANAQVLMHELVKDDVIAAPVAKSFMRRRLGTFARLVAEGPTPALLGPTGQGSRSNRPEAIAALPKPALRAGQNQGPSNAAKSLERRARISSTCSRAQAASINTARQECTALTNFAIPEAQGRGMSRTGFHMLETSFGANSARTVESVTTVLGNVQRECDPRGDSTLVRVVCANAGSRENEVMCAQGHKAVADPRGTVYLCPSFFSSRNARFGDSEGIVSPLTLTFMDELFRIDRLRTVTSHTAAVSNPTSYSSFVRNVLQNIPSPDQTNPHTGGGRNHPSQGGGRPGGSGLQRTNAINNSGRTRTGW